jgi:hypothetical protein
VVVVVWCGFFTDYNTTPTKVVLSCFGLLVGLWQLQWQRLVKRTIYEAYGNYLTCVIASSSKLKDGPMVGE